MVIAQVYNHRPFLAPIDKAGGGVKPLIISPNYSFINKLREKDGLPPLAPKIGHDTFRRILIMDDDLSMTEFLSDSITLRTLQLTGDEPKIIRPGEAPSLTSVNIMVANLPEEILQALDQHQSLGIDLVITDFNMHPQIRGDGVTKNLRAAGYSGFIFGATGLIDNRSIFYAAGVDLVLLKPIDLNTIDGLIK